jgi:hypothetical protein
MRYASVNRFSLHANTDVAVHRRDQLERLLRYTARGAVSFEWLTQDTNGDLVCRDLPGRGPTAPMAPMPLRGEDGMRGDDWRAETIDPHWARSQMIDSA